MVAALVYAVWVDVAPRLLRSPATTREGHWGIMDVRWLGDVLPRRLDTPQARVIAPGRAPNEALSEIRRELERGNLSETARRLRELAPSQPGQVGVEKFLVAMWNNLGVQQKKVRGPDIAVEAFRRAVALDPANPVANLNLAHAYWELHAPALTPEFLDWVIRLNPGEPFPRIVMAERLIGAGDQAAAARYLAAATERAVLDPTLRASAERLAVKIRRSGLSVVSSRSSVDRNETATSRAPVVETDKTGAPANDKIESPVEPSLETGQDHFVVKFVGTEDRDTWERVRAVLEYAYREIGGKLGPYPSAPISVVLHPDEPFLDLTGTPAWADMDKFEGTIIHPQTWPDDLDYSGKRVIVIGSGATAATLIPAIAGKCAHVTMLQRTPTYFRTGRNSIPLAEELRKLEISEEWIHEIVRKKILYEQDIFTQRSFSEPEVVKKELLSGPQHYLGEDSGDVIAKHFTPSYRPWRQRIAFIPDGDLFQAVRDGKASVVTDEIDRFVPKGILLKSGEILEADIIVTATGFNMSVMGDIAFTVDGTPLDFHETVTYRGMMFTGVPNLVWVFGYLRASWTLRADIVADFVCRLLIHMRKRGAASVTPALRPQDRDMPLGPWIDPENFNPGYVMRSVHLLPRCGTKPEWQHTQDYWADKDAIPNIDFDDAAFRYQSASVNMPTMAEQRG